MVNDTISGSKITGYIKAGPTAALYDTYLVTFKATSSGVPTPEIIELSFEIKMVKFRKVKLI